MKKPHYSVMCIILSLSIVVQSCQKEDYVAEIETQDQIVKSEDSVHRGQLLQNPYEIHTFRRAYQKVMDSLANGNYETGKGYVNFKKKKKDTTEILPNYLYIKFSPETDAQENKLREQSKIICLDYPFEYEDGEQYHKENPLQDGERLSYYASIPIDEKYPKNIPYTILQEMYVPEKDENLNDTKTPDQHTMRGQVDDEVDFINHVIEQAYVDTNNEDLLPEPPLDKKGCETCFLGINFRAKWRPSGNVKIFDDNMGTSTYTVRECHTSYYYDYSLCDGNLMKKESAMYKLPEQTLCPRRITTTICNNVTRTRAGSYVPIDGANILIRDTWTLDRAIADAQGNFKHKEVRAKVRYVIKWDRYQFSIRDHSGLTQAEDRGPKLYKRPWNLRISGGRMKYRGQIFQAAMHFYYHNIGGLTRPPTNGFWKKQMKITAKEVNGTSFHAPEQGTGGAVLGFFTGGPIGAVLGKALTSTIRIARYGETSEKVYGTTIHELAHASHWRFDKSSYNALVEDAWVEPFFGGTFNNPSAQNRDARRTLESWATGVEIYLTRMRYKRLGPSNYEYQITDPKNKNSGNHQTQNINGNKSRFYTSAVWDLVDNFNQRSLGISQPIDNVSGFTMNQLEVNMKGAKSWNSFRNNVLSRNRQKNEVKELFANWH